VALSHRRSEVLAALIGLVVLPPPLLSAQYRLCPPDTAIGGDPDDRTRLATLLGRTSGEVYLLRSWSSRMAPLDSARRSVSWCVLRPDVTTVNSTGMPFSLNDGALWAGVGWSEDIRAGLRVRRGRLWLVLAPEFLATENLPYPMPYPQVQLPRPAGRSPFSTPWHVGAYSIDLPLRFGDRGFWKLDPGQSTLAADLGPVVAGLSTESEWWGPGIENAIVMSNNAAGIPRAFVRTARPVRTRVGSFAVRWFLGGLFESQYFDDNPASDRRSITALAATWTPAGAPTLTLGFTRAVYAPLVGWQDVFGHALDVLRDRGVRGSGDSATVSRDQIFSLFGRWVFPADGFAVHAEWARTQPPGSLRELLTSPNHSQGYTLGLEWARPLRAARDALRVQAELTYLEQSPASRNLPEPSFYTGAAALQGYTQRGQVIGAAIGPGASSQWLAVDYFAPTWRVGVAGGRIRWDDDALYTFPGFYANKWCAHDVSLFGSLTAALHARGGRLEAMLTRGERLNVFFDHLTWCGPTAAQNDIIDVEGTTLRLRLSLSP